MSMNPGATTFPLALMVRLRSVAERLPIAAMWPSRIPMSPEYQGEPVPSMMCPLMMTMSKGASAAKARVEKIRNRERMKRFVEVELEIEIMGRFPGPELAVAGLRRLSARDAAV